MTQSVNAQSFGSEEQVESGLDRNKENLACLRRTKVGGGGAKTRITFKGTLLKKNQSLLYQHKRHFKQSLAWTTPTKFRRVHHLISTRICICTACHSNSFWKNQDFFEALVDTRPFPFQLLLAANTRNLKSCHGSPPPWSLF